MSAAAVFVFPGEIITNCCVGKTFATTYLLEHGWTTASWYNLIHAINASCISTYAYMFLWQ